jgi:hypothetical protein
MALKKPIDMDEECTKVIHLGFETDLKQWRFNSLRAIEPLRLSLHSHSTNQQSSIRSTSFLSHCCQVIPYSSHFIASREKYGQTRVAQRE